VAPLDVANALLVNEAADVTDVDAEQVGTGAPPIGRSPSSRGRWYEPRNDGLTDDELERRCARPPAPGYPDESRTVGRCLRVVMKEECEHRRYAVRDLVVLEARI